MNGLAGVYMPAEGPAVRGVAERLPGEGLAAPRLGYDDDGFASLDSVLGREPCDAVAAELALDRRLHIGLQIGALCGQVRRRGQYPSTSALFIAETSSKASARSSIRGAFSSRAWTQTSFRFAAPAIRAPLPRILRSVQHESTPDAVRADRRYRASLACVFKSGYYLLSGFCPAWQRGYAWARKRAS